MNEGAQQQTGADEHDDSERGFGDDQDVPCAHAAAGARRARVVFQRIAEVGAPCLHRRHEAAQNALAERDGDVERSDDAVHLDVVDPRERGGGERAQRFDAEVGERETGDAADRGEQHAFRQHLAQQPHAARAERGADGEFALARRRARQQQVADVRAHHQQQERDDAEHDQQRHAHVADHLFRKPDDRDADAGVRLRKLFCELARDGVEIALCLRERDAGLQPSEHAQEMAAVIRELLRRQPERQIDLIGRVREVKSAREDADDGVRLVVEMNRLADDGGIGRKPIGPERVAEQHDVSAARTLFLGGEHSPEERLDLQEPEQRRGDVLAFDANRLAVSGETPVAAANRGEIDERRVAVAPVAEVAG